MAAETASRPKRVRVRVVRGCQSTVCGSAGPREVAGRARDSILDAAPGYFETSAPACATSGSARAVRSSALVPRSGAGAVTGQRLKLSGIRWIVADAGATTELRCEQAAARRRDLLCTRKQIPAA